MHEPHAEGESADRTSRVLLDGIQVLRTVMAELRRLDRLAHDVVTGQTVPDTSLARESA